MVFDCYFSMNKKEWISWKNQDYRNTTEIRFRKYYEDFKELFDGTPENIRDQMIMGIKNRMFNEGLILENITFADWLKHISELKTNGGK